MLILQFENRIIVFFCRFDQQKYVQQSKKANINITNRFKTSPNQPMKLFNAILRKYLINQLPDIDKYRKHANPVQHKDRKQLIAKASSTEFGKKYNFKDIKSYNDFKNSIPIHTYDDLKPYIDRMIEGQQNILWPTHIKWFSKSSGTTNERSKYIPVSPESLKYCHIRGGRDV